MQKIGKTFPARTSPQRNIDMSKYPLRTNGRMVTSYNLTIHSRLSNQKINDLNVTTSMVPYKNDKKKVPPNWHRQLLVQIGYSDVQLGIEQFCFPQKVDCNVDESRDIIDFDASDDTRQFARNIALPKIYKSRHSDTIIGDIEIIEDDDIENLALQGTNDTEKHKISEFKTSSYQDNKSHGLIGRYDYMQNPIRRADMTFRPYLLYESMRGKTSHECDSYLAIQSLPKILHLLTSTFVKAVDSGNHEIATSISSYIKRKSSEIVKQFHDENKNILQETNVWMGTECLCKKTDECNYESKTCDKLMPLIIVEVNSELKCLNDDTFNGFPIKVITNSSTQQNESKVVAEDQLPESQQRLDRVPRSMAKLLFKRHSNLTMVCPSAFKSIGFNTEAHKILPKPCISLFCRVKGFIPIGEQHFPLQINGYQTDVLEGTSYFTSAVHIGDKIYNKKGEIGTLGGFVKYYGIDTFLTCAHVIFGKSNISNLQAKDIHFNCHTIRNDDKKEPVKCTLIRHVLNYDTEESNMEEDSMDQAKHDEETSVDAALVLIQMPNTLHDAFGNRSAVYSKAGTHDTLTFDRRKTAIFATKPVELRIKLEGYGDCTDDNTLALGLRSIYLNENYIDTEIKHSRAIALSAISGKQERFISLSKSDKLSVLVPSHVRINTCIMYNQFVIQNMDFNEGDSGTCIYAPFTGSKDIGCIGMLVGKSTSGKCIVTPMKEILKALGVDCKTKLPSA